MKKLVYNYDTGKWSTKGAVSYPSITAVSPILGGVKRTLDMFAVGKYVYGVFNKDLEPIFISKSSTQVLGINPNLFSPEKLTQNIPQRERDKINTYIQRAVNHLLNEVPEKNNLKKIRFDYSYIHPIHGVRRILQQIAPFGLSDQQEVLSFLFVFTDITYLKRSGGNDYSIVHLKNGRVNTENHYDELHETHSNPFTKRQREILTCLRQRMTTEKIANKLNISKNTVYNHRKLMLRKTGNQSIIELIIESLQKGWI